MIQVRSGVIKLGLAAGIGWLWLSGIGQRGVDAVLGAMTGQPIAGWRPGPPRVGAGERIGGR